jgi:hypothetical protein
MIVLLTGGVVVVVVVVVVDGGTVVDVAGDEVDGTGTVLPLSRIVVVGAAVVVVVVVVVEVVVGELVVGAVVVDVVGVVVVVEVVVGAADVVVVDVLEVVVGAAGVDVVEVVVDDVVGAGVVGPQNCTFDTSGMLPLPTGGRLAFVNVPETCGGAYEVMTVPGPPLTVTWEIGVVDCQSPPVAVPLVMVTMPAFPAGFSKT